MFVLHIFQHFLFQFPNIVQRERKEKVSERHNRSKRCHHPPGTLVRTRKLGDLCRERENGKMFINNTKLISVKTTSGENTNGSIIL